MRDIKYRALTSSGKWVYGSPLIRGEIALMITNISNPGDGQFDFEYHEIKKETIGKYTAEVDKNNNPIYEGDIVSEAGAIVKGRNQRLKEVIGNIYENPELLEKNND